MLLPVLLHVDYTAVMDHGNINITQEAKNQYPGILFNPGIDRFQLLGDLLARGHERPEQAAYPCACALRKTR